MQIIILEHHPSECSVRWSRLRARPDWLAYAGGSETSDCWCGLDYFIVFNLFFFSKKIIIISVLLLFSPETRNTDPKLAEVRYCLSQRPRGRYAWSDFQIHLLVPATCCAQMVACSFFLLDSLYLDFVISAVWQRPSLIGVFFFLGATAIGVTIRMR